MLFAWVNFKVNQEKSNPASLGKEQMMRCTLELLLRFKIFILIKMCVLRI